MNELATRMADVTLSSDYGKRVETLSRALKDMPTDRDLCLTIYEGLPYRLQQSLAGSAMTMTSEELIDGAQRDIRNST